MNNLIEINLATSQAKILEPLIKQFLIDGVRESRKRNHWHASDLGYCVSGVYYSRLLEDVEVEKQEIDTNQLTNFALGSLAHSWLDEVVDHGAVLLAKEEELAFLNKKLDASGRADVLLEINNLRILMDFKTVKSGALFYNEKRGMTASMPHKQQLHFYYDNLKKKIGGDTVMVVSYLSKNWDFGIKTQDVIVPYDKEISKMNEDFFLTLKKAWKDKVPPKPEPDVILDPDTHLYTVNWKSKYCNYHTLCTGNENWEKDAQTEAKEMNKTL